MEYNLPHRISSEKDLKYYEQYLESESRMLKPAYPDTLSCNTEKIKNNPQETKIEKIKIMDKNPSYRKESNPHNMLYWNDYLKKHIGKLLKVESLICERLESRIGILLEVGNDFLVIKPNRNCCSMIIGSESIEYITIIHNSIGISKF